MHARESTLGPWVTVGARYVGLAVSEDLASLAAFLACPSGSGR